MNDYAEQAQLFKALAHPVRLQILDILRRGAECVCHMEAVLKKRQAYISQQLMTLRDAGLVDSRKDGLNVFYFLVDPDALLPLLEIALGPLEDASRHQLRECVCPHCEAVVVAQN
ncbi:MAG: winged helix-turn-helix transcriptional regulator [Anaerolineae bacterium]|nr:winged helix-turn-helix transcriptional regulator [Anaerolineae bacterium]